MNTTVVYLTRSDIPTDRWNDFIETAIQKNIYAQSWYLDIVAPRWGALILTQNTEWQAVMPVTFRKKWGQWVVHQPLFCQFLGIFSITESIDFEVLLAQFFKQFRYVSSYYFNPYNTFEIPNSTICHTHWLKITADYQQNFTADRLRNLTIAQRYNWELTESDDIVDLLDMFIRNHASKIEGGVSASAYRLLLQLHQTLTHKNKVKVYYASKNHRVEAGIMCIKNGNDLVYIFNSATATGRKHNARTSLIDKILIQYPNHTFDFESPEIPAIASHYQSFGAEAVPFKRLRYNNLPFLLRIIQRLRLKIWQKIK